MAKMFDPTIYMDEIFESLLAPRLLSAQELATLDAEQMAILRANVRSEILSSPEIHKVLDNRVRSVMKELRQIGAKGKD